MRLSVGVLRHAAQLSTREGATAALCEALRLRLPPIRSREVEPARVREDLQGLCDTAGETLSDDASSAAGLLLRLADWLEDWGAGR
jgi:hypothetical protein